MNKPTLHMIGLFHTIVNHDYDHCAFTGKVLRFSKMMRMYGYKVIEYSNGHSISEANEHIEILSKQEVELYSFGTNDFMTLAVIGSPMWEVFNKRLILQLARRVKPGDIVCHPFGNSHVDVVKIFNTAYHVETGIGYDSKLDGAFRIFESNAVMHDFQGRDMRGGNAYEWVIPNYYDITEWEPNYEKGKYILYIGRLIEAKGLYVIREIASRINEPIKLYGLGDPAPFEGKNMEFCGVITGQKARSDLFRNAKVVLVPSQYVEPFAGVHAEAMLCGTPVITTDFGVFTETVEQGKTGFRCHVLGDYLKALKLVDGLDRKYISDYARSRFSLETVGKLYDNAFRQIQGLQNGGWYTEESYNV